MTAVRAYVASLVLITGGAALLIAANGLPWLTLAVPLGVVATRGWVRVAVAGVLAVSGMAGIAVAATSPDLVGVTGGVLMALGGTWAVLRGRDWPAMSTRYERGDRAQAPSTSRHATWDALDRGQDPTDDLVE